MVCGKALMDRKKMGYLCYLWCEGEDALLFRSFLAATQGGEKIKIKNTKPTSRSSDAAILISRTVARARHNQVIALATLPSGLSLLFATTALYNNNK